MNDERITKNTVGLSKFLDIKKDLKSKNKSIILESFKENKKQKEILIGVIGLMSINLIYSFIIFRK